MWTGKWMLGTTVGLTLAVAAPAGAVWTPPVQIDAPVTSDDPSVALAIDERGRAVVTSRLDRSGPGCRGRCGAQVAVEGAGSRRVPALAAPPALLGDGTALFLRERAVGASRAELSLGVAPVEQAPARYVPLERYGSMQFASRARIAADPSGHAAVAWIAERGLRGGPLRVAVRRPGRGFGRRVTLTRRPINALAIAVGARGDVLVAYQRAGRIYARVQSPRSSRFGAAIDLGPGSRASGAPMTAAADASGRLAVAWTAVSRPGRGHGTVRVAVRRGGRFATREVSGDATVTGAPQVALGGDGTVAVGWNAPATEQFADDSARLAATSDAGLFQLQDVPRGISHALAARPDGTMVAIVGGRALVKPPGQTVFGEPEQLTAGGVRAATATFAPDGTAVAAWRDENGAVQLSRREP